MRSNTVVIRYHQALHSIPRTLPRHAIVNTVKQATNHNYSARVLRLRLHRYPHQRQRQFRLFPTSLHLRLHPIVPRRSRDFHYYISSAESNPSFLPPAHDKQHSARAITPRHDQHQRHMKMEMKMTTKMTTEEHTSRHPDRA